MQTTQDFLDAVKSKVGIESDYKLAQTLDVSRAAISKYRNNGDSLSDETALKVASVLEIEPIMVIAAIHAEKAKTEETKKVWSALLQRLSGVAATFLIATGINVATPSPANAGAVSGANSISLDDVYYVKFKKNKK